MEWLNDKKNQPIIAAIAIVIIVGVVFGGWWFFIRQPAPPAPTETSTNVEAQPPGTEAAPGTVQPGAPEMPGGAQPSTMPTPTPTPTGQPTPGVTETGQPGSAPAAPAALVATVKPMETWRGDPFLPIGYKPPPVKRVNPPIRDFPFEQLFQHKRKKNENAPVAEIQQPSRRMAGILLGDRVYAIIETNGVTQVVQPGDYTTDRLAIVQKIEPDKVVLKTVDEKPRYVTVRMAASPVVQTPSGPAGPSAPSPSGYTPPGAPPRMGAPPDVRPPEMP